MLGITNFLLSIPEELLEAGRAGLLREVHPVHGAHPLHQDGDNRDQNTQVTCTPQVHGVSGVV
jgi:hypothetical protein